MELFWTHVLETIKITPLKGQRSLHLKGWSVREIDVLLTGDYIRK